MGLFSNLFGKQTPTADERLATGELNWRLKPKLLAIKEFPNFIKFISRLELENNIQFGLHNDVVDEMKKTLILTQAIYNKEGHPIFRFSLFFLYIQMMNEISLMGTISNFYNPLEVSQPKRELLVNLNSRKSTDLSLEEYEKYYWELLNQSLSLQSFNPSDYSIKRENGMQCIYKVIEQSVRDKYK